MGFLDSDTILHGFVSGIPSLRSEASLSALGFAGEGKAVTTSSDIFL